MEGVGNYIGMILMIFIFFFNIDIYYLEIAEVYALCTTKINKKMGKVPE